MSEYSSDQSNGFSGEVSKPEVKTELLRGGRAEPADVFSLFPLLSKAIESEACGPKDMKKYVKAIISLLGNEKARELEEGWMVVRVMECEFHAKRSQMIVKQNQANLDAFNSSNS